MYVYVYVYMYVVYRQANREGGRYIVVLRCDEAALEERELLEAMKLLQFLEIVVRSKRSQKTLRERFADMPLLRWGRYALINRAQLAGCWSLPLPSDWDTVNFLSCLAGNPA